eukprot:TRINITY_DN18415_c0_g1_i1.p1 TRINITY_DN18415_c0_g1~~TRINITY_DN18415_c0_g1_i1.p1  ORF type:complete len:462 (-),score=117.84 TRINITY_DN18415_c0_g1_i1:16-1401(-)
MMHQSAGYRLGVAAVLLAAVCAVRCADVYVTRADHSALLQWQAPTDEPASASVDVSTANTYQSIAGFGFTMTCGSASLLYGLPAEQRTTLLRELFGNGTGSVGFSFLRMNLGSCDMCDHDYTYDDVPEGEADPQLSRFSINCERAALIPLLREIYDVCPGLPLLATPWSAPVWMKDKSSFIGGSLQEKYYGVYADYFVKYITAMAAEGITITAITPQNEPLNGGNEPSLVMPADAEATFIKKYLGPAFTAANISTKIVIYDHNCDRPDYPETILADAGAAAYVDGSAFHLYAGDVSAMTEVHDAAQDKHIYFTEQYTAGPGDFGGDLDWAVQNLLVGASRNWARTVLLWNLAADAAYKPHTPGGCSTCLGGITVDGTSITRNVGYYIIAHASKFVRPGWLRTDSSTTGALPSVAFVDPVSHTTALIMVNLSGAAQVVAVKSGNAVVTKAALPAGAVATIVW